MQLQEQILILYLPANIHYPVLLRFIFLNFCCRIADLIRLNRHQFLESFRRFNPRFYELGFIFFGLAYSVELTGIAEFFGELINNSDFERVASVNVYLF
ncbi:hypothetical protein L2E82_14359 [Cichorium intybus]|uniref:Uncharacterized protein n=1 Tax=Cichorium intybus TaxID=13427 RepID=A0ACB9F116_CICIN|nr:hypothetical protein L2E82_14359 [Cichorium intybus]